MITNKKGFTLIELLIVIAILAVLAGIVVVTLNPAELLKQARDAKRIADMDSLTGAINFYLTDVTSPNLCLGGAAGGCINGGICTATSTLEVFGSSTPVVCGRERSLTAIDGTGWVDVNFSAITGGSPFAVLPLDPTNIDPYFYAYKAATSTAVTGFELNTRLESVKLRGKMQTDGGDRNDCADFSAATCWLETGSYPGFSL